MPILDIQKRARELGRIRLGQVKAFTRGDGSTGTMPAKLDRFRLTSASKPLLDKVAELYGGTVEEWTPQGGGAKAWEVVTNSTRLPIMVPPQPVSQWYEYWTGGGCKHRCDGNTNVLTDELCDPEDFNHKQALERPTTRLNVVLRDVEGIGVWRIETHGWNAAMELPDAAEFLARAGGYVNGWVSLEERTSKAEVPDKKNGGTKIETRHFMVPIIEIDVTPAELMAGKGRIQAPELEGPVTNSLPPGTPAALPAGRPDYEGQTAAATTIEQLQTIWHAAADAGHLDDDLKAVLMARGGNLPQPDADGAYPAEVVEEEPDPDVVWQKILKVAGEKGMGLSAVTEDFKETTGIIAADATGAELARYLHTLSTGEEPAA